MINGNQMATNGRNHVREDKNNNNNLTGIDNISYYCSNDSAQSNLNNSVDKYNHSTTNNNNRRRLVNNLINNNTYNNTTSSSDDRAIKQQLEKKPIDDDYDLLGQIGRGSYASVFKAIHRRTGKICAIKKIPMTSESTNLINEIRIMSECEHDNIVRYLDSDCSVKEVSIVMEYCCGGSVKDVMKQLDCTLTLDQLLVILKDVLNGIDYLHSKNKIHRDVKAANILLNETGVAKLGDFGVSEPLDTSSRKQSIIGTLLWLPPEVINQNPDYGPVIDIWSLGITIIEMADGQPPYSDMEQSAALREISNLMKPSPTFRDQSRWPNNLKDFLSLCLEKEGSKRKGARELLDHDLFREQVSRDVIKSLVERVCLSPSRKTELESDLCRRSESLLREICILFGIYKDRRMKVIKVDQMTEALLSTEKSFKQMQEAYTRRDKEIAELRSSISSLDNEINSLRRQKDDLKTKLEDSRGRKVYIKNQIQKIEIRRMKLRLLESKSTG